MVVTDDHREGASDGDGRDDQQADAGAPRAKVLCVDDEPMNLELLERSLRRRFAVLGAPSPERALELLREHDDIAVVLSDFRMPGMTGAELLAVATRMRPEARRVIVTGYADGDNLLAAINAGQIHYVVKKPWRHPELHQLIDQMVRAFELERENKRLMERLHEANERLAAKERLLERSLDERGRDLVVANTELERINRELEVLSYKDSLTGLYNHRAFQERLGEEVARAQRYAQPLSLIIADIDGFAALNQELGYQLGDEVLRRLAIVLGAQESPGRVRASDVAARFAGEEFAVIMPETQKSGAVTKALRLRDSVARADFPAQRALSISIGVASFPDDAENADGLVTAATAALRGAKRGGSGRVHFFSQGDSGPPAPADATTMGAPPPTAEIDRFRPYHERMGEVISFLQRDRAISCILVDLTRLRRIEVELGIAHHAEIYDKAGHALDELRGELLKTGDLICRTSDDDGYLVILSPREGSSQLDLERLGSAVEGAVENALAPAVRDLLRDTPRITVGSARVLGNTMLRPERLIARLVHEATESARLGRERAANRDKSVLQDIILGDGLTPVYQPIVHVESSDIFGYEALTRGPRHTAMESPATLFSVADEVDLTFELDRACFRGALRGAMGLEPVHRLFVNLLPLSFYDAAFIEIEVSRLLEAANLTPANIVFEITERLAIENFTSFRRALAQYTAMGFGVAIDDVGTRHSNLETVMALRPHFIKISDVLTRGVARSTVKREMLRSLGHIAEAIDAVIVAEGIETADDLHALHDLGVKYGQGYFLARPGPPFPRLRASVKRAIKNLTEGAHAPIAAPPADFDDDGDIREAPPLVIDDRRLTVAAGSGEFAISGEEDTDPGRPSLRRARASTPPTNPPPLGDLDDAFDEGGEVTRPHPSLGSWKPLVDELGASDPEAKPLIESLKKPAEEPHSDPSRPRKEPGDGLN
ncbi:MAG TPA: EAL domain-containing protein [Kofleriaceae bacterium]|nr:EAL domain-containing protein [Kofleriaceae bacterium]